MKRQFLLMEKPDGLSENQFEILQREMNENKFHMERGQLYFHNKMPFEEIVDRIERRGWKCAQAEEQGKKAQSLEEDPHRHKTGLTYEKALLSYHFGKGFLKTHPNP